MMVLTSIEIQTCVSVCVYKLNPRSSYNPLDLFKLLFLQKPWSKPCVQKPTGKGKTSLKNKNIPGLKSKPTGSSDSSDSSSMPRSWNRGWSAGSLLEAEHYVLRVISWHCNDPWQVFWWNHSHELSRQRYRKWCKTRRTRPRPPFPSDAPPQQHQRKLQHLFSSRWSLDTREMVIIGLLTTSTQAQVCSVTCLPSTLGLVELQGEEEGLSLLSIQCPQRNRPQRYHKVDPGWPNCVCSTECGTLWWHSTKKE